MELKHHIHLAYCTNIHRGQNWPETFETLKKYTLRVRDRVAMGKPYAIGLRLSDTASRDLSDPETLKSFQRWLEKENCYIFTINGFPYGSFHGGRVKELAYTPDWTMEERVQYTNRLFDLLGELAPAGVAGSVSTVPGSFKPLIKTRDQVKKIRENIWRAVEHVESVSVRTGKMLHLGLEPEPLCFLETSQETLNFFHDLCADRPQDERISEFLGVNYDCCHLAVEYEQPEAAIKRFTSNGIRISKLHFSSALKVIPTKEAREALKPFVDSVYFHQVIALLPSSPSPDVASGGYTRYMDLDEALAANRNEAEWRIHFHVPLHCRPSPHFDTTADHLLGIMDLLKEDPTICSHIEMETYTWEVLPEELKNRDVVDQLVGEYEWTLTELQKRGLA